MSPATAPRRRVVITGLGALTPVGETHQETWSSLIAGRSGIGRITRFDASGCTAQIAGEVKNFDPSRPLAQPVFPRGADSAPVTMAITPKDVKKLGRFSHLGVAAGLEAYIDSGLDAVRATLRPDRVGVNMGVGLGGLPEIEAMHSVWLAGGFRKISPFFILQTAPNILSGQLAILLDFRGPNVCNTAACATSGHSLGESLRVIQRGEADIMLAGGAEGVIGPLGVGAFAQMRALSTRNDDPERASRPYDVDRDGFVMGEGAVAFVLEEREHALQRGARIYAELAGYAATGDAYHLSSLAPEGEGSRRAMALAIDDAGLQPADLSYVSAHATSTPGGDGEEAAAIAGLFGEARGQLHVSGVKSMTGHLLGAAGALGAMAATLAIHEGVIPPTINLDNVDPACAALGLNFTPKVAVKKKVDAALANSFGFGGTNASLVVRRA
ncbi:beta-ketoacyl-ACP synthase II [Horticoccus luteus]|uniref:3-oxoacyl-[acyl-carrier-protein] synthase 2 n=1 Tax=Horticoccus luteus TaxID=2862869 RepID=A0A8F9XKV1_9BACT|nr:beta-ketoacyl-ACP synthase II [Horticoccus luteus]QYM80063.1 beta-ketoacyl-ACP synthase II [Horticoccus luteus]